MDGLSYLNPHGIPLEIGAGEFLLAPLRLKHFAEMEYRIVRAREEPIQVARPIASQLPEPHARLLLGLALDDARKVSVVPNAELVEWMQGEGLGIAFGMALREHHPDVAHRAARLLDGASYDEGRRIDQAVMEASGLFQRNPEIAPEEEASPIDWGRVFRGLTDHHHWTPADIWNLTLAELAFCLGRNVFRAGTCRMSRGEAEDYRRERQEARERTIEWLYETM